MICFGCGSSLDIVKEINRSLSELGRAFSGYIKVYIMESLILAQDERWRRA